MAFQDAGKSENMSMVVRFGRMLFQQKARGVCHYVHLRDAVY